MTTPATPPPPAWHALPAEDVAAAWQVAPEHGLDASEAAHRLARHGPNCLPEPPRRPAWRRWLQQFHNPLIYVLLVAAAITLALGSLVDAGVILGVVLVNAFIGHLQEGKAERALDAVRSLLPAQATVLRAGERQRIAAAELVPGDLVLLEAGDQVPADLRLLRARNLRVVEAALTGESLPVDKASAAVSAEAALAERRCLCFSGTQVTHGQGLGVVVASGRLTELGRIGALVDQLQTLSTPLTRRLDQFARQITLLILLVSLAVLGYGHWLAGQPLLDLFLAVVGLAVAAIPEGLPAVVTIVLAIGTRTMARQRAVVRRLPAVETLGSVSVICTDKTGTLTRNEMTAVGLALPGAELMVSGAGYAPSGGFQHQGQACEPGQVAGLAELARCALLCNDARLQRVDEDWQLQGDPTEGALLSLALKAGLEADTAAQWPRLDALPFESERQYMATLHHDHQGRHLLLLKGAPERVLALCIAEAGGAPLRSAHWQAWLQQAAGAGQRVLALAQRVLPQTQQELCLDDIRPQFELLGLVGLIDPPRPEAVAAIAECQGAGIRVKMITGDHAVTAAAIGAQLGLRAERALTGNDIEALDDAGLRAAVRDCDVFARASPEHKLRLVGALQAQGQLVAMTGDGVNDAPALRAADVGVAMGGKGTDAARAAADLVLTDDHFATIARAVREGRVVYDNIKKALMHMLPTNGGEAGVILLALLVGLPLPVTPGQILWVNTVTSVTLALALAFEAAEPRVMHHPPRAAREALLTPALAARILYVIVLMVAATFFVFQWELGRGSSLELARTAAVNTVVACELFYLFNVRHFTRHAWRLETLLGNRVALGVAALLVLLQLLFTYAPPLQQLFHSRALDLRSWAMILAMGALLFVAVEAEKLLLRRLGLHRL